MGVKDRPLFFVFMIKISEADLDRQGAISTRGSKPFSLAVDKRGEQGSLAPSFQNAQTWTEYKLRPSLPPARCTHAPLPPRGTDPPIPLLYCITRRKSRNVKECEGI